MAMEINYTSTISIFREFQWLYSVARQQQFARGKPSALSITVQETQQLIYGVFQAVHRLHQSLRIRLLVTRLPVIMPLH